MDRLPTGSAPLPYGISGGPLIFLGPDSDTDVPLLSVIGYGMEYDGEGKKIIAGPSDAIIGLATNMINMEAKGKSLMFDKD